MRDELLNPKISKICDRQIARCLDDIAEVYKKMPELVADRIKKAVRYTAADVEREIGTRNGKNQTKNWNK